MEYKKATLIFLVGSFMFFLTLIFTLPSSSQNNKRPEQSNQLTLLHAALKQDLVSATGEKILEIIEASYQTSEKSLDSSSIRVRNLSGRNITAIGIIWTIKFTDTNICQLMQVADYRLHKDMVEAKGIRPFAPYEEKFIPRLTKQSFDEEQKIESVGVEISFVEFEDSDGVGIEKSEMYEQVISKRKGAELYKQWIETDYEDTPQKMAKVIEKLQGDGLPNNKELENSWVEIGASSYRQWMRDILNNKGEILLREQIHRQLKRRK
ncbi:MAG TPA: hypothetical protein VGO96_13385 [Pyrinomonadaceae bacterium]|jgi:hypothetical protein|nr:hypothetical protein [Pyrinomonadaceae bacterium]